MAVIKQYVNLPAGVTNIQGPTRHLRVTPSSVPGVGPGDRVEWWIEPDPGNTDIKYLPLGHRAHLQNKYTTLSPGGHFDNTIHLPQIGGDKYVVKASKKGNRAAFVALDAFEIWRKLYYSLYYVGTAALTMFNNFEATFKQAFADGFIEMENVQKVAALTDAPRIDVTSTHKMLGGTGVAHAVVNLKPHGTGHIIKKPFHAVFLVMPEIYEIAVKNKAFPIKSASVVGTTQVKYQLFKNPPDATAFAKKATVHWPGHSRNVKPQLSLVGVPASTHSSFHWDLRTVAGLTTWLAHPGHSAQLRLTLLKETDDMGFSIGNLKVVRTIDGSTDVLQTFTHELGHGIGQTVHREPRWNAAGAAIAADVNPKWHHDNFGGQGDHCSYHAGLTTSHPPGTTSHFEYGGAGNLCTMFWKGENHVDPQGKFCPFCLPRMKRLTVNHAKLAGDWNDIG